MLQTVYYAEPIISQSPSPWFQVQGSPSVNTSLDLAGDTTGLFWRGVYSGNLWLDGNHSAPGFGYLGIMAAAFAGAHGSAAYDVIGDRAYNLAGARFSFDVRASAAGGGLRLGKCVRLIFWVQFRDLRACVAEGRYVNVGYVGQTIDRALGFTAPFERPAQETRTTEWVTVTIPFDPARPEDWVLYGAVATKADIYGVPNSLRQLFERWDWNLGIHAVHGPVAPAPSDLPYGHLNLRYLRLEVDDAVNVLW